MQRIKASVCSHSIAMQSVKA